MRVAPWALAVGFLLAACHDDAAHVVAQNDPAFQVSVEVSGLGPVTDLAFLPDGRMVITEKDGTVRLRSVAPDHLVTVAGHLAVDTASEKGLLGVVVPPGFGSDGRIVLYRSVASDAGGTDLDRNRVASFRLGEDGLLDLGSEQTLVSGLRGPANHDGGGMVIGPDGKLYVGVGDSGCNSGRPPDPPSTPTNYFATCLTNGNGKILRVDLDGSIPVDNPLVAVPEATACGDVCGQAPALLAPPRTDIWAWGFRNPWRFTFDAATDLLWVADVGEVSYEEVTIVQPGRHHGWPWREGRHGWPVGQCRAVVPDTGDCIDPVYECHHGPAVDGIDGGCESITGGAFLTGPRWPDARRDRYVFGDNVTQDIWSIQLTPDRRGVVQGSRKTIAHTDGSPVSFRTGPDGDLFVALLSGQVLRISPAGGP